MKQTLLLFWILLGLPSLAVANDLVPAPAKVVRYAQAMLQRYDEDGDGILQQEEWKKMPGTPQAIDLNGDGQITQDELVHYLNDYGQRRSIRRTAVAATKQPEPYKFDPANLRYFRPIWLQATTPAEGAEQTRFELEKDDGIEKFIAKYGQTIDDEDVYRKLQEEVQIPARLYYAFPEHLRGVPAWFLLLDKDGDGQVSLAEFAPASSPEAMALFEQFDKNGNGFIEPDEVRESPSP